MYLLAVPSELWSGNQTIFKIMLHTLHGPLAALLFPTTGHYLSDQHILSPIKVKKFFGDSLDSIPSPSVKIKIMGGKSVKAKHC